MKMGFLDDEAKKYKLPLSDLRFVPIARQCVYNDILNHGNQYPLTELVEAVQYLSVKNARINNRAELRETVLEMMSENKPLG